MATKRFYPNPLEWVKLAASKDPTRPVLNHIEISDKGKTLAATDSWRIHVAELDKSAYRAGLYTADLSPRQAKGGPGFPDWRTAGFTDTKPAAHHLVIRDENEELRKVEAVLKAAIAANTLFREKEINLPFFVSLPVYGLDSPGERAHFQPRLLYEAFCGLRMQWGQSQTLLSGSHSIDVYIFGVNRQVILQARVENSLRTATIMPLRSDAKDHPEADMFKLDPYLQNSED